jgi:predicted PurR-regulated permease PerM
MAWPAIPKEAQGSIVDEERGPFLSNPFVARAARWGLLAWSVIGLFILVGLAYRYVLFPIRIIFPPLVVALVVIYLLAPLVERLQRRGMKRIWATLLVYLVFLVVAGAALGGLIPVVANQVNGFVKGIPQLIIRADRGLADLASRLGLNLDAKKILSPFEQGGSAFRFFSRVTSFTSGVAQAAFVLLLGPLLAFYLLVDLPKIQRGAEGLVPASRRSEIRGLVGQVNATLGGFFRGQLLVAVVVGAASMLGFWLIGLPFFALMGAVVGLLALVPLIGIVIAAVPTLFVAFTAPSHTKMLHVPGGWWLALASVVVLVLAQQLDSRFLGPRLLRPTVRLHPVSVLLSLLIGGTLLGLWGMLLAVPMVAALKVLVLHVWDTRSKWPPDTEASARAAPSGRGPRLARVDPTPEHGSPPARKADPAAEPEIGAL